MEFRRVRFRSNVVGTDYDDTVTGDDGDNAIHAGAGDDQLAGGDGDDVIDAGDGDDTVIVFASSGNDHDDGDDVYHGGAGIDAIDLTALVEAVVPDIQDPYVAGAEIGRDTINNFEIVLDGRRNDKLNGRTNTDNQHGAAG